MLVHIKFLAGTSCRSWCPSLINPLCSTPVSGIQNVSTPGPVSSIAISSFYLVILFYSSIGTDHHFWPLCGIAGTNVNHAGRLVHTGPRCITALVRSNLWAPIICKAGGVGSTVRVSSSYLFDPIEYVALRWTVREIYGKREQGGGPMNRSRCRNDYRWIEWLEFRGGSSGQFRFRYFFLDLENSIFFQFICEETTL